MGFPKGVTPFGRRRHSIGCDKMKIAYQEVIAVACEGNLA